MVSTLDNILGFSPLRADDLAIQVSQCSTENYTVSYITPGIYSTVLADLLFLATTLRRRGVKDSKKAKCLT